jgi:hypothetical protein
VLNLEIHVKVCFKRLEILTFPCEYMFSLMNFIVNNEEHFQTNSAITVSVRGIRMSCIDQLPTTYVLRREFIMLPSEFSSLLSCLTSLINKKEQFKVALKRYVVTHSFYSVDDFLKYRYPAIVRFT